MFRALTGPSSGVSLAVIMIPFGSCSVVDCSCVRGGGLVVLISWLFLYARCLCGAAVVSRHNSKLLILFNFVDFLDMIRYVVEVLLTVNRSKCRNLSGSHHNILCAIYLTVVI
jgi:hypothetical protein